MMTHRAIARRFKAGESVRYIASTIAAKSYWSLEHCEQYVQHAIREVMKRQGARRRG